MNGNEASTLSCDGAKIVQLLLAYDLSRPRKPSVTFINLLLSFGLEVKFITCGVFCFKGESPEIYEIIRVVEFPDK